KIAHTPRPARFPYTTLFRSNPCAGGNATQASDTAAFPACLEDRRKRFVSFAGKCEVHEGKLCLESDAHGFFPVCSAKGDGQMGIDRKSTRLNSSHVETSYAV